jgi:hypothetical protein
VNLINGNSYCGQRRCPDDKTPETDDYLGSGKLIKLAIKKYGKQNFIKHIILKNIYDEMKINFLERVFIKHRRMLGKAEYNISTGGSNIRIRVRNKTKNQLDLNEEFWKNNFVGASGERLYQKAMDYHNLAFPTIKGYFLLFGIPTIPWHHTEKAKQAISDGIKKCFHPTGWHHTEKAKQAISKASKGNKYASIWYNQQKGKK